MPIGYLVFYMVLGLVIGRLFIRFHYLYDFPNSVDPAINAKEIAARGPRLSPPPTPCITKTW